MSTRKDSGFTVRDLFCGGGGFSLGIKQAAEELDIKGIKVTHAMNHWKLACNTHETNFPDTVHTCADVSASDPYQFVATDVLIGSPECKKHTTAIGKEKVRKQLNIFETQEQAAARSRATMWDIPRFAEAHRYNFCIVENVVDAKRWKPYNAWLKAMHSIGYYHQECFLNSMHFWPTPQSRDRMYVVFWKRGNKKPDLNYTPLAWCPKCEKNVYAVQYWKPGCLPYGKYRTQYVYKCSCSTTVEPYYYAAMNCID